MLRKSTSAGPPWGTRHLISPKLAEKGVMIFLLLCQQGVLGDEKHLVFECPALQDLRDRYHDDNLFEAPQGDAMIFLMWQAWDDTLTHAKKECTQAGPPMGNQV